jgi:hypothetical protein
MSSTSRPQEPSPEFEAPVSTLDALRDLRHERAEQKAQEALRGAVIDRISLPMSPFVMPPATGGEYDIARVSWDDYLVLDKFGYSPDDVASVLQAPPDTPVTLQIHQDAEHMDVNKIGEGLTLRFKVDGTEDAPFDELYQMKPQAIRTEVIDRYKESPAHRALHELAQLLDDPDYKATTVKTDWFNPDEDHLGTLGALSSLELIDSFPQPGDSTNVQELLEFRYGIQIGHRATDQGEETTYTKVDRWNGLIKTVHYDEAGRMAISFATDPQYWYAERANNARDIESVPFIETRCAEEFFDAIDKAGLVLQPRYMDEMVRVGEAERFGGVYTQMSREIAKWVDSDERREVGNLFVLPEGTVDTQDAALTAIEEQLFSIDESAMAEPAKLLFRLMKQSITRDARDLPELPVTRSYIHIEYGACFDVASYYLGAADFAGKLQAIQVGDVSMLEKTYGSHTFLLQEPAVLNGVELPKGTLVNRGEDGGWAMQRLTPFCFDNDEDRLAMGSEIDKAYENQMDIIRHIGGATLASLIEAAR